MSFSKDVKRELSNQLSKARHCRIAELAVILQGAADFGYDENGKLYLKIETENLTVAQKSFTLLKCTFDAKVEVSVKQGFSIKNNRVYHVELLQEKEILAVLKATKMIDESGSIWGRDQGIHRLLVQNTCCKRAFIRGAFLVSGSMTNPDKGYHFEIALTNRKQAEELQRAMQSFGLDAKIVVRKKYYVVYVKEGAQIVDVLGVMEASVALMNLENIRILKEVRNSVNRKVNCETANISKTVSAATKQIEDITYIRDTMGFSQLNDGLVEVAEMRLAHPEMTLQELCGVLTTPISKSGVNHRLRKLSEIAENLRQQRDRVNS